MPLFALSTSWPNFAMLSAIALAVRQQVRDGQLTSHSVTAFAAVFGTLLAHEFSELGLLLGARPVAFDGGAFFGIQFHQKFSLLIVNEANASTPDTTAASEKISIHMRWAFCI